MIVGQIIEGENIF